MQVALVYIYIDFRKHCWHLRARTSVGLELVLLIYLVPVYFQRQVN